jgi:hypothetical protein
MLPLKVGNFAEGNVCDSSRKVRWISDLSAQLAFDPIYKFLSIKCIPQMQKTTIPYSQFMWNPLLKRMYQMNITASKTEEGIDWSLTTHQKRPYIKSFGNILIVRGNEMETADKTDFEQSLLYSSKNFLDPLNFWWHKKPCFGLEKSVTLVR